MGMFEFIIRMAISIAIFYLTLTLAFVPYINDEPISTGFVSIFFGTEAPIGFTRDLLLLSRGLLGLTVFSWVFVPSWRFFYDADFRPLARDIAIFLGLMVIVAFFGALLYHINFSR